MLSPKNLGLAAGIIWGVALFLLTLISLSTGYAHNWLTGLTDLYPGYSISGGGSIIGLIYGFIDGFIWLFLLGWLYNKLCSCDHCCTDKCSHDKDKPKDWK